MWRILQGEWVKVRHTSLWIVAALFPLLAVILGRGLAQSLDVPGEVRNPWFLLYIGSMPLYSYLLFPILIGVIMAFLGRVEHEQNSWKQVLSLPVKREYVYIAKFIIGIFFVLYNVVILALGMIAARFSMDGYIGSIPFQEILGRPFLACVAGLPIMAIQFYLSMQFRNTGLPIALAVGFTLPGMMAMNSTRYWIYYPWSYPMEVLLTDGTMADPREPIMYGVSIALSVSVFLLGLFQFKEKDMM